MRKINKVVIPLIPIEKNVVWAVYVVLSAPDKVSPIPTAGNKAKGIL